MQYITDWAGQIAAYLIFSSVLNNLIRRQNYLKYVRLVMGIILILLLARPAIKLLGQSENYQFYLSRYLLTGEAADDTFLSEISVMQEELLLRELEDTVKKRIETLITGYGLVLQEAELSFCTEESAYGRLDAIRLVLRVPEDRFRMFGTESPDAIRIRECLSEEFGMDKNGIQIIIN